jgi:hypothetical protein
LAKRRRLRERLKRLRLLWRRGREGERVKAVVCILKIWNGRTLVVLCCVVLCEKREDRREKREERVKIKWIGRLFWSLRERISLVLSATSNEVWFGERVGKIP